MTSRAWSIALHSLSRLTTHAPSSPSRHEVESGEAGAARVPAAARGAPPWRDGRRRTTAPAVAPAAIRRVPWRRVPVRRRMVGGTLALALVASLGTGCAVSPEPMVTTPRTYQGAGAGAAVGAGAGALIDKDNRWRGAALGAALGAVLGGTLTEVSARASREAATNNRPVTYQSVDGWQRVEAQPQGSTATGCRQVRERVYQDGQLVREQTREVC